MIGKESKLAKREKIDRLLRPKSIALIGASTTHGSLGESVLNNLMDAGYSGDLYLVNPKRPVIRGRICFGSIDALPLNIDCAVLAIPGSAVVESARSCAKIGTGSIIVFSAGFAEGGEAGLATQRELASIVQNNDMILEGPNCLGMVNYVDRIPLTFVATPTQQPTDALGAAIISQSGALAAVIAVNMRHQAIPLRYSVSTGNEASSGVEDFVEYMIGDKATRVLVLIVEQFRQPKRFLQLAREARAGGQYIVLLHPGRCGAARASAATHTGAIAGDYAVMHTLVTDAGVIHVESLEELVDVSQLLVRCRELPRGGAAIFTESGAFKARALDLCDRIGLELPSLSLAAEQALQEALPAFIPPSNPLDLTAQGLVDPSLYRRTLSPVLDEDRFGSVLLAIILTDPQTTRLKLPPILEAIRTLKPRKPVIFAGMDEGAPFDCAEVDQLRDLGVSCFPSPERAIRALAYVSSFAARHVTSDTRIDQRFVVPTLRPGLLVEYMAKQTLARLEIPIPVGRLARTLDEAIKIAREIGFPVVLKAQSVDLPHKSDVGGVILGLATENAVVNGWSQLHNNLRRHRPELVLDGVLVESMGDKGVEMIVGARNDSQWGPVLLVGFGGVLAEAIRDVRLLAPDLSREAIKEELNLLRCCDLLRGFRGSGPLDVSAIADVVARLGDLVRVMPHIEEIDINPLVVYANGNGVVALDCLISVREPAMGQSQERVERQ